MHNNIVALLSLDEIDRVKKINHISSNVGLQERTGVHRNTWGNALKSRKITDDVIQALIQLGANPAKLIVTVEASTIAA